MTRVKICGVTTARDALFAARAGASMLGLNLIPESPRFVDETRAREIADAVRGQVEIVGVVANGEQDALDLLADRIGLDFLQLHGDEDDRLLRSLRTPAWKAVRIGSKDDVALARTFGGERLLVDARAHGALGGTGKTFDWSLVVELGRERRLILAGGLTPANVALAIRDVRPWAIDVASGVERSPGEKDDALVTALMEAVRAEDGRRKG